MVFVSPSCIWKRRCPFLKDPVFCDALAPKLHIFGSFPVLKSQALCIFILQLLQHQFSAKKNAILDGVSFWTISPPSSPQRNCRRTSFEEVKWRTEASAHRVCHLQSCPWFGSKGHCETVNLPKKKFQFYKIASSVLAYLRIFFVDNKIAEYDVSEDHLASLQSFCSFSDQMLIATTGWKRLPTAMRLQKYVHRK